MDLAKSKRAGLLVAILLLCGSGAFVSNGLLQFHDGVAPSSTASGRFVAHLCSSDSQATSGCQASARSPWSEWRLPVPGHPIDLPVAFAAIAYFLALGCWFTFVGDAPLSWIPMTWLPLAVGIVGVYASLFFMSLMAMGRAPWCGGCITVHAINLLLVVAIGLSRYASPTLETQSASINHRQTVAIIGIAMLLIFILYSSRERRLLLQAQVADLQPYKRIVDSIQEDPKLMVDAYLAEPRRLIPIRTDEAMPGTKHQLVVFLDYECPGCAITANFIQQEVLQDFDGSLNVVVRHYPLCTDCNAKIPKTIHPEACIAADAAEAARLLGGRAAFNRMSELLFANQPFLATAINPELASKAGVDPDEFVKLMHQSAVQMRVEQDIAQGHALGVTNTPTLFLDGRQVPSISLASRFWKTIATQPTADPQPVTTR